MVKKVIYKILVILIVILIMGINESYAAIGKNVNKEIGRWVYSQLGGTSLEEVEKKIKKDLKEDFNYNGPLNQEIKFKTIITLKEKGGWIKKKYTVKIRNR